MNKTNIFWTITLTRGKYHQLPQIDGKWFDYLNFTSIISQRIVLLSPILQESFPRFLACWWSEGETFEHLSTHFLSPALLCINYDLSLGIFQNVTLQHPSGIRDWNKGKFAKFYWLKFDTSKCQNIFSFCDKLTSFYGFCLACCEAIIVWRKSRQHSCFLHPDIWCVMWWRESLAAVWHLPPQSTTNVKLNFVIKCQSLQTFTRKI